MDVAIQKQRCDQLHAVTDGIHSAYLLVMRTFPDVAEAAAAARAVWLRYAAPMAATYAPLCAAAREWQSSTGCARLLNGLAVWGRDKGFEKYALSLTIAPALWYVFNDPASSTMGSPEADVAFAATTVVTLAKDGSVDTATHDALWPIAYGGAHKGASPRLRVGAMKALQATLRRGKLLPGQVTKDVGLAETLYTTITAGTVGVSSGDQAWLRTEAGYLRSAANAAKVEREMIAAGYPPNVAFEQAGYPPPPGGSPATWPWWSWALIASGGVTVAGGAAALALRSRRGAAP